MRLGWRPQLALVLLAALLLRSLFFVGFSLGDDPGYIGHADEKLAGRYPPLEPLNQYAYRPLLLLLFAGGIALFGHTALRWLRLRLYRDHAPRPLDQSALFFWSPAEDGGRPVPRH